jgi:pimeloyl-ACP methyl ester carboxylesterase
MLAVLATVLATVLPAAALAGCGGDGSGSSPAPSAQPAAGAACPQDAKGGTAVRFADGADGTIAGLAMGAPGGTWVVLAHMAGGDVCQWLAYGRQLDTAGYRVLALDLPGNGASTDTSRVTNDAAVVRAADYVRTRQRAGRVVVMGASMGGTAVLAAAPAVTPPVAGVVSLSAPASYAGVAAGDPVRRLSVPVLYVAGALESDFAPAARRFADDTPAGTPKKLLLVDGSSHHGTALLRSDEVLTAVREFLASYAPA